METPANSYESNENERLVAEEVTDYIDQQVERALTIKQLAEILIEAKGVAKVKGIAEPAFIKREFDSIMYLTANPADEVWSYFKFKRAEAAGESAGYQDGGGALPLSVREKLEEFAERGHVEVR
jgi:hypothetical protein